MSSISVISKSKVAPASIQSKKNNFVKNELNIINQSKFLIFTEAFLGMNRLHLFQYNKLITIFSSIYSLVLLCEIVVYSLQFMIGGATFKVTKYTVNIEYTLFVLIALTSNKNQLKIFFKNLSTFDEALNIQNDLAITSSMQRVIVFTLANVLCNTFEIFLICKIYHVKDLLILFNIFVIINSHDIEQVFFFTFLRDIYMRILILKAHVAKLFDVNKMPLKKLSKVEKLSEKIEFDVSTLHRVYELLHACSKQLNSTMNIPVCIEKLLV